MTSSERFRQKTLYELLYPFETSNVDTASAFKKCIEVLRFYNDFEHEYYLSMFNQFLLILNATEIHQLYKYLTGSSKPIVSRKIVLICSEEWSFELPENWDSNSMFYINFAKLSFEVIVLKNKLFIKDEELFHVELRKAFLLQVKQQEI